ncbi:MAG: glycosyltransferase [Reyranellaceae bacterium]
MAPLVSVIIPTFNRRSRVLRALDSVERQDYPALEVVVVDDASTDGTAEAIAARQSSVPVRVIGLPTNFGPGEARNAGVAGAAGKYVAFLDSDDHWLPGKLRRQVEAAEQAVHKLGVLVYSRTRILRRHEAIVRPHKAIAPLEAVADYLFANAGYLAQSAMLVPTAVARAVPFRDMAIHEDWDWYIRLQAAGAAFLMLPEVHRVVDDRGIEGRRSQAPAHVSLSILDSWKSSISSHAYLGLRARIAPLLRSSAPGRAMHFIVEAYRRGAIDHWQFCALTGRLAHPQLRDVAYRLRGAWATMTGKLSTSAEKAR